MANDAHVVPDSALYMFGDVRGNENPALTSLQTLFLREHNRKAREYAAANPTWTDEELYQEARRWVIAMIQKVTLHEYFPITVGDAPPLYPGYNATLDPSIITEFSTGGFRYGHSEVAEFVWRIDATGKQIPEGHLHLRNNFFNSPTAIGVVGIEPILRGLVNFTQNAVDIYFVDDLKTSSSVHPELEDSILLPSTLREEETTDCQATTTSELLTDWTETLNGAKSTPTPRFTTCSPRPTPALMTATSTPAVLQSSTTTPMSERPSPKSLPTNT
jgi:hypothetical protein